MPSQSQLIPKINRIFRSNKCDFEFNRGGVCNGLSALFTKYTLQNQEHKFFHLLATVNTLLDDYKLGTNPEVDKFLVDVETAFRPGRYNRGLQQSDIEKFKEHWIKDPKMITVRRNIQKTMPIHL